MFKKNTPHDDSSLDVLIERMLCDMNDFEPNSSERLAMVEQIVKLHALRPQTVPKSVNPDVLATIIANLIGIIVIVGHERAHVVTSKAVNFVMKLR